GRRDLRGPRLVRGDLPRPARGRHATRPDRPRGPIRGGLVSVTGLHLVTDATLPRDRLLAVVDAAAAHGAGVVQVRAKHATARDFTELVLAVSATVADRALVLVNDRVDVAVAARHAGARVDGVHLGQDDLEPV